MKIHRATFMVMSLGLGYASVYAYPRYYTEFNEEASESEDTANGYPDQKKGTIKTMFQEILLRATSSSSIKGTNATNSRIFTNLFSMFFLLAGCWGDLLIIRIFLTCAYIFMIPFHLKDPENYAWAFLSLYLHGSGAVRLVIDEGKVKLDEKQEQEALWRYFYRLSGISRLLFKAHIAKCFELVDAKAGEKLNTNEFFHIILDGKVDIETSFNGSKNEYTLVSGESFNIKHLGPVFRVRGAYLRGESQMNAFIVEQDLIATVSPTADAKLYRCSSQSMHVLCNKVETKDASQGLLISTLSEISDRLRLNGRSSVHDNIHTRSAIFDPLEDFAQPAPYLAGSGSLSGFHHQVLHTLKASFLLPWPLMTWVPGLRQIGSLPFPAQAPPAVAYEKKDVEKGALSKPLLTSPMSSDNEV